MLTRTAVTSSVHRPGTGPRTLLRYVTFGRQSLGNKDLLHTEEGMLYRTCLGEYVSCSRPWWRDPYFLPETRRCIIYTRHKSVLDGLGTTWSLPRASGRDGRTGGPDSGLRPAFVCVIPYPPMHFCYVRSLSHSIGRLGLVFNSGSVSPLVTVGHSQARICRRAPCALSWFVVRSVRYSTLSHREVPGTRKTGIKLTLARLGTVPSVLYTLHM